MLIDASLCRPVAADVQPCKLMFMLPLPAQKRGGKKRPARSAAECAASLRRTGRKRKAVQLFDARPAPSCRAGSRGPRGGSVDVDVENRGSAAPGDKDSDDSGSDSGDDDEEPCAA